MVDVTELEALESHTYDWFFHSVGIAEYKGEGEDVPFLEGGNGYEHFSCLKKIKTEGEFSVCFIAESGERLTLTVENADKLEVYTAQSPDNPANRSRFSIILRQTGCCAAFRVRMAQA